VRESTTADERPAAGRAGDDPTELGTTLAPTVVEQVRTLAARVVQNVGTVVRGKPAAVELCLVALLAEGHLMLEDFPGVGKTLLAKSLARSIDCRFSRIQFTPDLLPSDVTGVSIFNQKTAEFEFRGGPIFANIVLADEINRASPKTQSSLLECMQEHQATIDRATYPIERPFMVIGTENPIEYEGTYPLPEAQLDRFMLRLSLGYPSHDEEMLLLSEQTAGDPLEALAPVISANQVMGMVKAALRVAAAPAIRRYVVDLLTASRADSDLYLGASPRAGVALLRAAKAQALLRGRDYVVPQDVKDLAGHVLCHRVIPSPDAKLHGRTAEHIVTRLLDTVPVPIG
jgi:MoxR-like ATPase